MYARFQAGTVNREEYIVPCDLTGRTSGNQTQVRLSVAPPREHLSWTQWVANDMLLTDEEAEV